MKCKTDFLTAGQKTLKGFISLLAVHIVVLSLFFSSALAVEPQPETGDGATEEFVVQAPVQDENAMRAGEENGSKDLQASPQRPFFSKRIIINRPQVRNDQETAVLNFSDANLRDVLRTITELTGVNFILSPGVNAKISVQTAKPVPKKDIFPIFESLLEINGLSAIKAGSYYKIVQAQSAKQRALELYTERDPEKVPAGDRMLNLVLPVEFISANDLAQVVKPMLSPAGSISSFPKANTLIITDIASNVKSVLEMVKTLDSDVFDRMEIALIPLKSVDVKTIHKELTDVMAALGIGKDTPQFAMVPLERLNSLILFSSTPELIKYAGEWIEKLDKGADSEGASIHIYYVQNDKASNIKNLLDQIFGGKKAGLVSAAAQTSQVPGNQGTVAANTPGAAKYENPGRSEQGQDDIKIHIYEPSNAIIIQSSGVDYQNILNTIKELDKPPKQVLIDAMIMEVKLDESTKYGIQWSALEGNTNIQQNTGILSSVIDSPRGKLSLPIGAASPTGLSVFATDASKFFAVIQLLASKGNLDVLSNPHIVVKNYEKASINVGSDEPVATQSTQTAVTGTTGIIQNIEYRKTGVILTVTPQITEGGMVSMTIRQEVSDKSTDRTVGNAIYPSFSKREAETSVVAKDKETLVIGGLIQERNDRSHTGIPWLSDIPLLGYLFRTTNKSASKTELVILLTPRVISNSEQAFTETENFKNKLEGLKKELMERKLKKN